MSYRINTNTTILPATNRSVLSIDSTGNIAQEPNPVTTKSVFTSTTTTSSFSPIPPIDQQRTNNLFRPVRNSTVELLTPVAIPPQPQFAGGVLAPDGNIYMCNNMPPTSFTARMIKIPTFGSSNSTTYVTISVSGILETFTGPVLGPNGKLYLIPFSGSRFATYNIQTGAFTFINVSGGLNKWFGGTLAPNGKIYCVPYNSTAVLIINTANDSLDVTSITGVVSTGGNAYVGSFLSKEGFIYMVPFFEDRLIKINPATNAFSFISVGGSKAVGKWMGVAVSPINNAAYIPPFNNTQQYIKFNTSTDTFSLVNISSVGVNPKFIGAICGPDSKIYFIPYTESNIYVIDTAAADAQTTISTILGATVGKFAGAVVGLDGYIYMAPYLQTSLLRYKPPVNPGSLELKYITSSYRNKSF